MGYPMLIVGKTKCGKTHYLLKYLETECQSTYENIYIICPTFSFNPTWQEWKYKNDPGVTVFETRDVNGAILQILTRQEESKYPGSMLILDDVAATKDVKSQSSELVNLGFAGRYHKIDVKAFRENMSFLVTFYTTGKRDMKVIVDDYLDDNLGILPMRG